MKIGRMKLIITKIDFGKEIAKTYEFDDNAMLALQYMLRVAGERFSTLELADELVEFFAADGVILKIQEEPVE